MKKNQNIRLAKVMHELNDAEDLTRVMELVRTAARDLIEADGATFILRDGDLCYYADEDAISPLWKGKRFKMEHCISGWVMLNAQSVIIDDIYTDYRIPFEAYQPTFVKSLIMVPIGTENPVGAIGGYWAQKRYSSAREVASLQMLADITYSFIDKVRNVKSDVTV